MLLQGCLHFILGCFVLFLTSCAPVTGRNCSHPLVPEHVGFRCEPSPCAGFPHKSILHFFCEPGFSNPTLTHSSRCVQDRWVPSPPSCVRSTGRPQRDAENLPSVATTAIAVSLFLLTTTVCMVIKSQLFPCSCQRRSPAQMEGMLGVSVSLPTYEETLYADWEPRPHCSGPAHPTIDAPPPYEERQRETLQMSNAQEKDVQPAVGTSTCGQTCASACPHVETQTDQSRRDECNGKRCQLLLPV